MTVAAIAGLGFGALHAVTGPDHLLSLAPAAVARRRGAWRTGLAWGAGHALGTAGWFLVAAFAAALADPARLGPLAERAAGVALAVTGAVALGRSWRERRRGAAASLAASTAAALPERARAAAVAWPPPAPGSEPAEPGPARSSFLLGGLHGVTGAAAVLLLLPAVTSGGPQRFLWLAGFAAGSTAAMAGLTAALAVAGGRLPSAALRWAPTLGGAGSIAVGVAWALA